MPIDLSAYHGPAGCLEALQRHGSVMITGRSSCESGRVAYRAAVQDLLQGASILQSSTGLQVASVLPPAEALERMLREAPAVTSKASEGRKFTNRYLQWSSHEHGIHVLLSAGSGRKVDENLIQPALTRTAEVFRALKPGLLFAKRLDRIGRRAWAFGPLMELIEQAGSWMGDEDGVRAPDEWNAMHVFMTASRGQKMAQGLPTMTRRGMASRTGSAMANGRVAYHVPHPPPPGTTRLGMLSVGGGLGGTLLVLDSPAYLPSDAEVATGMPQVFGPDGQRVDQVANVRWALSVLGRPQWSRRAVATELSRRQMSTHALRANNGSSATVVPPQPGATVFPILSTILNNLDLYETGRLHLKLSVDGIPDLAIDGIWPEDGPWASPEDFARIRAWLAQGKQRHDRTRSLAFTSLPALLNGEPARLLSSASRHRKEPGYAIVRRERLQGRQPRSLREPVVTHAALAESIVAAISQAGDLPLALWQPAHAEDHDLQAAIGRLKVAADSLQAAMRTIRAQVAAVDDTGAPRLTGPLLDDLNAEYARLAGIELPDVQNQLQQARQHLEDRRIARGTQAAAAQSADILKLVSALRNPHDLALSELWRASIVGLTFTTSQDHQAKHVTDEVSWHGRITFSNLTDRYAIDFSGTQRTGAGSKVDQRVTDIVADLASGTPFHLSDVERKPVLKGLVAARFKVPNRQFLLGACLDGRITKTAARLLLDPERPDHDLATDLHEPEAFIARIREVYCNTQRQRAVWLQRHHTLVTHWHAIAATCNGTVHPSQLAQHSASASSAISTLTASPHADQWTRRTDGSYQLTPCKSCGGHRRAPMRIPEPVGLLCLDCRQDQHGLHWPTDPYDTWRCTPAAWDGTP